MKDNKYITAYIGTYGIALYPKMKGFYTLWNKVNVSKLLGVMVNDLPDGLDEIPTSGLTIAEAEESVRRINEYLRPIAEKNLAKSRKVWVERFNNA